MPSLGTEHFLQQLTKNIMYKKTCINRAKLFFYFNIFLKGIIVSYPFSLK